MRFWGVRGSIPCPGEATARYGGNTSCLEIRCGERLLVFDAGTGIYALGKHLQGQGKIDADLFLTHTHYDHIWGWPHFPLGLEAGNTFRVRAGHLAPDDRIERVMMGLLADKLNPLNVETLRATLRFEDFEMGDTLEPHAGIRIRTVALNHPDHATGYRVEYGGRSICYLTDHEHTPEGHDKSLLELIDHADIVIYDATYTDEEYPKHVDWGHSTWQEGARLCDAAAARTYVVFHHDPGHDDRFMDGVKRGVERMRPGSVVAREGMVLHP